MTVPPQIFTCVTGPMANNCYAVLDPESLEAAVIDPGFGGSEILEALPRGAKVTSVLLTHGHFDHVAGVGDICEATGASVWLHPDDRELMSQAPSFAALFGIPMQSPHPPSNDIVPGEPLRVGKVELEVRHCPGHSPGGVVFVTGSVAFVGDSIFAGSIGRTDLPGADHNLLLDSIERQILSLGDDTVLLSGHGPETTAGRERLTNPFLMGRQLQG